MSLAYTWHSHELSFSKSLSLCSLVFFQQKLFSLYGVCSMDISSDDRWGLIEPLLFYAIWEFIYKRASLWEEEKPVLMTPPFPFAHESLRDITCHIYTLYVMPASLFSWEACAGGVMHFMSIYIYLLIYIYIHGCYRVTCFSPYYLNAYI